MAAGVTIWAKRAVEICDRRAGPGSLWVSRMSRLTHRNLLCFAMLVVGYVVSFCAPPSSSLQVLTTHTRVRLPILGNAPP